MSREGKFQAIVGNAAPEMVATALPFLDGQGRAKSWAEQVSEK